MELSDLNIKKFFIFSQKKAFLIFREMKLSYILGNENPGKIPYISGNGTAYVSGSNCLSSKNCFLCFGKWNFIDNSIQNFL